jgi:hypothetical protein
MSELIFILASLVYVVIRTHAFSAMSKSASAKMMTGISPLAQVSHSPGSMLQPSA